MKYLQRIPLTTLYLITTHSIKSHEVSQAKDSCTPLSPPNTTTSSCPIAVAPPLNPNTINEFFNKHIPKMMNDCHVAGSVVTVVQNGQIIKHAYGYSNLERQIQVDPDKTLFRPGSISKLFVWTALFQLFEEGKVDLNEDINLYLNLTNVQKVTIANLMSHTAGYEDFMINLFIKDPNKIISLENAVMNKSIQIIYPPGEQIAYSNYGSMVAGLIVERVSGMPFEEYVKIKIFDPLGMKSSTFSQVLPIEFEKHMSVGYAFDGNATNPREFEIVQGVPAGGLSSTAADMAKFLQAHLSQDSVLLKPSTLKKMHSTLFTKDKRINGMAHGFIHMSTNGQYVIGHGGDTIYFHSVCFLIPMLDIGVFFSVNTGVEGGPPKLVNLEFYGKFMDHFFPSPTGLEISKTFHSPTTATTRYSGTYLTNRHAEHEIFKILKLMMNVKVRQGEEEGMLKILKIASFMSLGKMETYTEIATGLFQKADGQDKVIFLLDEKGNAKSLIHGSIPMMQFNRPHWYETPEFTFLIVVIGLVVLIFGLIVHPTGFLASKQERNHTSKLAEWVGFVVIISYLIFLAGVVRIASTDVIFNGVPTWLFYIPWVAFSMSLSLPVFAVFAWRNKWWGAFGRCFYTLFAIEMQLFFWVLWYWALTA